MFTEVRLRQVIAILFLGGRLAITDARAPILWVSVDRL